MTEALLTFWQHKALPFIETLSRRPRLLSAAAGLMAALVHPPFGVLPGLLGYPLLMLALERIVSPRPLRSAFFAGWLAGFTYFFVSCFWVAEAFLVFADSYGWMAPFAATLLPAGMALFWGLFACLYRRLNTHNPVRFVLFASLFTLIEALRGMVLTGFPWNPSGASWLAGSAMSQFASIGGIYGLGFVTVLAASSFAATYPKDGLRGYTAPVFGVVVLASVFTYGALRLHGAHVTPTDTIVRIVQPAIGQREKWTRAAFDKLFMSYIDLSRAAPQLGRAPDIIIWPEGALPPPADELFSERSWTAPILLSLLEENQSLIMGVTREDRSRDPAVWRNSMLVLHRKDSQTTVDAFYDKFKLVPFGEFTPGGEMVSRLGIKALNHLVDGFAPGVRTHAIVSTGVPRFLPMICFEAIFPGLDATKYRSSNDPNRPRWIVNISNDAWFGPTSGPRQHLNLASYRAIEEGLPMVRATPTGISVLVDNYGREINYAKIDLNTRGYRDFYIPQYGELTPFTTLRNHILFLPLLLGLIILLISRFVRTRSGR